MNSVQMQTIVAQGPVLYHDGGCTQAWSWVNGQCAHASMTSLMNSQSCALKLIHFSRERQCDSLPNIKQ